MPFIHDGGYVKLPVEYVRWESTLNEILKHVPVQEDAKQHYITINSEFFTESGTQRREGIHIDGNFCVDPNFIGPNHEPQKSWGGMGPTTWGGIRPNPDVFMEMEDNSHVQMDWVLPYDVVIPIAKYVSEDKGGLFVLSSNVGTRAWDKTFKGLIGEEGSCEHLKDQLTEESSIHVPKNQLVFMSSNTPHETLPIEAGTRRTFMRLTLNHNYDNRQILKGK